MRFHVLRWQIILHSFTDMIIDNDPPFTRNISIPRDMSQLSCSSFSAGIVEAVLDGLGFVRQPSMKTLVVANPSTGRSLPE